MSDLMLQPPPERDLPPGRHGALRGQLINEIASRNPRRAPSVVRRRLLPMVAAAAVLIVIAGVVGALIGSHRRPNPTVNRPAKVTIEPVVPGYTHAELTAIKNACVEAAKKLEKGSQGFGTAPLEDRVDVSSLRVYNVVSDDLGAMALLYGTDGVGACYWNWLPVRTVPARAADLTAKNGTSSVRPGYPQWLTGPVTVEAEMGTGGTNAYARISGRVTSNVARLEVTVGGKTASVVPVNGTYIATLRFTKYPANSEPVIHAYDRTNKLVTVLDERAYNLAGGCVVTPQGVRIAGGKTDVKKCTEAVPWR
jgi:hypothetical protein